MCGNDLGQWRAYADNGRGYSLGFNREAVEAAFIKNEETLGPSGGADYFPVTYDDNELSDIHRQLIANALPYTSLIYVNNHVNDIRLGHWSTLLLLFAAQLLRASVYFKHKAYENEREYRLLEVHTANPQPEIKYRARHYSLIKHRDFDWKAAGSGVLKTIIIGPAADYGKSKRFAEDCLRESGIGVASVGISQSRIPYKPA